MQQRVHSSGVHQTGISQPGLARFWSQGDSDQRSADPLTSSLKWQQDGELSELDLHRILTLLSQVDPVAEALVRGHAEL